MVKICFKINNYYLRFHFYLFSSSYLILGLILDHKTEMIFFFRTDFFDTRSGLEDYKKEQKLLIIFEILRKTN